MFLVFVILWIIFNGKFTWEILFFGILIAAFLFAFLCKFMDYSVKKELQLFQKSGKFIKYVCTLVLEVIKANLGTVHLILTQKEEIQPVLVKFHSDLKEPVAQTLLANAITLTPGTITVTLENGDYTVHCLDESLAEGLDRNIFTELAKEMEQKEISGNE